MMGARLGGLDPFPIGTTRKMYQVDGSLRLEEPEIQNTSAKT
jgi:hypothetical protein